MENLTENVAQWLTTNSLVRACGISKRRFDWLKELRGGEFEPVAKIGVNLFWTYDVIPIIKSINAQTRTYRPARADDRRRKRGRKNG